MDGCMPEMSGFWGGRCSFALGGDSGCEGIYDSGMCIQVREHGRDWE